MPLCAFHNAHTITNLQALVSSYLSFKEALV
jgi:hypothetical protein